MATANPKLCNACKTAGVWVRQSFAPSEISWMISATINMVMNAQNGTALYEDEAERKHVLDAVPTGLSTLRKLLVAVPDHVRPKIMAGYEAFGFEFVFTDCETAPSQSQAVPVPGRGLPH